MELRVNLWIPSKSKLKIKDINFTLKQFKVNAEFVDARGKGVDLFEDKTLYFKPFGLDAFDYMITLKLEKADSFIRDQTLALFKDESHTHYRDLIQASENLLIIKAPNWPDNLSPFRQLVWACALTSMAIIEERDDLYSASEFWNRYRKVIDVDYI